MTQFAEIDNQKAVGRKQKAAILKLPSADRLLPSGSHISPLPRFDHHGKLTPPSMVNVLPVM